MFFANLSNLNSSNKILCKNCAKGKSEFNIIVGESNNCESCRKQRLGLNKFLCKNCSKGKSEFNIILGGGSNNCESCKEQRIGYNQNIKKEEESLLKYGYSLNDTYENRIKALHNAISNESKAKILRHINTLKNLQKSNKKLLKKLNKDIEFIEKSN